MKTRGLFKKISTGILLVVAALAAAVFIYRYQIIQYSTETIIRKLLPDYVTIDRISFNFKDSRIALHGFRILNPQGFSRKYLLEVSQMSCAYKLRGKNILDGFEVLEPVFQGVVLEIERRGDGRVNLVEMQKVMEKGKKAPVADSQAPGKRGRGGASPAAKTADKSLSDVIVLPETYVMKAGEAIFTDSLVSPAAQKITFGNIDASLSLTLNKAYTGVLRVSSAGSGNLNGRKDEVVRWNVVWDPTAAALTMSNRFEVFNVTMKTFEPYYDTYSPFIFNKGRFSGTLIFDFDNGSIGSTNEVHLADLSFSIKQGRENTQVLETTVPDLAKYFTSRSGDIVFDFKIKGQMSDPKFFLGPISKQAMMAMAIDKVSAVLAEAGKAQQGKPSEATGEGQYEQIKGLIEAFKGLADKKK